MLIPNLNYMYLLHYAPPAHLKLIKFIIYTPHNEVKGVGVILESVSVCLPEIF
jgi:hypothetical protein